MQLYAAGIIHIYLFYDTVHTFLDGSIRLITMVPAGGTYNYARIPELNGLSKDTIV